MSKALRLHRTQIDWPLNVGTEMQALCKPVKPVEKCKILLRNQRASRSRIDCNLRRQRGLRSSLLLTIWTVVKNANISVLKSTSRVFESVSKLAGTIQRPGSNEFSLQLYPNTLQSGSSFNVLSAFYPPAVLVRTASPRLGSTQLNMHKQRAKKWTKNIRKTFNRSDYFCKVL